MKRKRYICAALLTGCLSLGSCSLDEYNPSGGPTVEEYWSTPEGYKKLINGCYYTMVRPLYGGGEDYHVFWEEAGTDIWQGPREDGWMPQCFTYKGLNGGVGTLGELWRGPYEGINLCNAAIEYADKSGLGEGEKEAKAAEAYFLRAYYNLILVEHFGGVYLPKTYTKEPMFDIPRMPVKDFYDLIFSDLQYAMTHLPQTQSEVGRATRAAAYHLYAKACLQRAPYEDVTADEKRRLYGEARDKAEAVITHDEGLAPGIALYSEASEIFDVDNNKRNTEALWVVSHSTIASLNANTPKYWNRVFKQFGAIDAGMCGVVLNKDSLPKFERRIMPTRFMLELYSEPQDTRYAAFFREKYYADVDYTWTESDCKKFDRNTSAAGVKTIRKGDVALWFTREHVGDEDARSEAVIDIDKIYDAEGKATVLGKTYYPVLRKYEVPGMYEGELTKTYTSADNIVYRLADTYLLAAEAWFRLDNKGMAAGYINEVRNRACRNHDHSMDIGAGDVTEDFILDERARELVGEYTRWMDLKRFRLLKQRAQAHNPNITTFDEAVHYLRPIPEKDELNYQKDPDEFQNPGY